MDFNKSVKIIEKAIKEQLVVKIRHIDTDFDIELQPLVYGSDFMQHNFVWGYIPFNEVYYKFLFDFIEGDVKPTATHFELPAPALHYYYAFEEEHYALNKAVSFWSSYGPDLPKKENEAG